MVFIRAFWRSRSVNRAPSSSRSVRSLPRKSYVSRASRPFGHRDVATGGTPASASAASGSTSDSGTWPAPAAAIQSPAHSPGAGTADGGQVRRDEEGDHLVGERVRVRIEVGVGIDGRAAPRDPPVLDGRDRPELGRVERRDVGRVGFRHVAGSMDLIVEGHEDAVPARRFGQGRPDAGEEVGRPVRTRV
jgi:hypothetical protein